MNKKYLGLLSLGSVIVAFATSSASLVPTGVGTYSAWTPSTGSTHYTLVDETSCNGTTDYVSATIAGNRDSYAVSVAGVPDGSLITGISITSCASKSASSGTANMSVFYRLNGTNGADGAAYALSGTKPVDLTATNYTGLSVTKTSSTMLEVGSVFVSGTTGARLSRIATVITYTTIPPIPSNVTSVASSSSSIRVSWFTSSSLNQDGFSLERSIDGTSFNFLATTSASIWNYLDTGLTSGTYYYRVRAYNVVGYSGYSSTTVTTLP